VRQPIPGDRSNPGGTFAASPGRLHGSTRQPVETTLSRRRPGVLPPEDPECDDVALALSAGSEDRAGDLGSGAGLVDPRQQDRVGADRAGPLPQRVEHLGLIGPLPRAGGLDERDPRVLERVQLGPTWGCRRVVG
jgi:hypothetical protein